MALSETLCMFCQDFEIKRYSMIQAIGLFLAWYSTKYHGRTEPPWFYFPSLREQWPSVRIVFALRKKESKSSWLLDSQCRGVAHNPTTSGLWIASDDLSWNLFPIYLLAYQKVSIFVALYDILWYVCSYRGACSLGVRHFSGPLFLMKPCPHNLNNDHNDFQLKDILW